MPNKLNKQEFKNLYDNCYLTGWTMSKFYDDLYEEYQNRFDVFFNYYNSLNKKMTLKVLIGEAPPYFTGNMTPFDKTYIYDTTHTGYTPYLTSPLKKYNKTSKIKSITKSNKLLNLAMYNILLIDIFPFPIYTNQRDKVMFSKNNYSFEKYFKDYFLKLFNECISKFSNIEVGFMCPLYTAIQSLKEFNANGLSKKCSSLNGFKYNKPNVSNDLNNFIKEIKFDTKILSNFPILINKSGQPNFNDFFNGKII